MLSHKLQPDRGAVFNAKILLFGEYTLITGSRALALPLPHYDASFQHAQTQDAVKADFRLDRFCHYLKGSKILSESMDLDQLERDIVRGIYLESSIPRGYGIGSSGALCAAIYARYAHNFERQPHYERSELNHLKDIMALMENFYHGTSSGLDCLISLVNSPVLIHDRNQCEVITPPDLSQFGHLYLYDSGGPRGVGNLVPQFVQSYETMNEYRFKTNQMHKLVNDLIEIVVGGQRRDIHMAFRQLSQLQYDLFQDMIPDAVKPLWRQGLETDGPLFKLCGAGGGGFFLVYSKEPVEGADRTYIALN